MTVKKRKARVIYGIESIYGDLCSDFYEKRRHAKYHKEQVIQSGRIVKFKEVL